MPRKIRLPRLWRLRLGGASCGRHKTLCYRVYGAWKVRFRMSAKRHYNCRRRSSGRSIEVRSVLQVYQVLPQTDVKKIAEKRSLLCRVFKSRQGKRSSRGLLRRLYRLRTVREKLPVRSDYHAIQSARIRLYKVLGLRYLRGKMPVAMYFESGHGQELDI